MVHYRTSDGVRASISAQSRLRYKTGVAEHTLIRVGIACALLFLCQPVMKPCTAYAAVNADAENQKADIGQDKDTDKEVSHDFYGERTKYNLGDYTLEIPSAWEMKGDGTYFYPVRNEKADFAMLYITQNKVHVNSFDEIVANYDGFLEGFLKDEIIEAAEIIETNKTEYNSVKVIYSRIKGIVNGRSGLTTINLFINPKSKNLSYAIFFQGDDAKCDYSEDLEKILDTLTLQKSAMGATTGTASSDASPISSWFFMMMLVTVGLWKILAKFGRPGWMAIIPGLRYYVLSKCIGKEKDGLIYLFLAGDLIPVIFLMDNVNSNTPSGSSAALIFSIWGIAQIVFYMRINSGLCRAFNASKLWLFAWLFFPCLPAWVFGFNKKYQPYSNWQAADFIQTEPPRVAQPQAETTSDSRWGKGQNIQLNSDQPCFADRTKTYEKTPEGTMKMLEDYGIDHILGPIAKDALSQKKRLESQQESYRRLVERRFGKSTLSANKYLSVVNSSNDALYHSLLGITNRMEAFDSKEYLSFTSGAYKCDSIPDHIQEQRWELYEEYLQGMKELLADNEHVLAGMDRLIKKMVEAEDLNDISISEEVAELEKQLDYYSKHK